MKKWLAMALLLLLLAPVARAEVVFLNPDEPASETSGAASADNPDEGWPRRIVVTVGGDCTLGSTETQATDARGFPAVVADLGYAWPFSGLLPVFQADDLTLVNFEGTLTESTDKVEKLFNFKGPAEYAKMLTLGGVEAVTLANNHFGDYGQQGKEDTMLALTENGITFCAPGHTAIHAVRGVRIGLIGNTFAYKDGKCDISKDVKALREAGCQIVIASFHWGSEYEYSYTRDQKNIGRAAIKSGADVVVGHHPHVLQGIERYEDSYILYSLGNLVFGGNIDPDDRRAYVARLVFDVYEDGSVEGPQLQILPVLLTEKEKGTDYRPVLAEGQTADTILRAILSRSVNMDGFINEIADKQP